MATSVNTTSAVTPEPSRPAATAPASAPSPKPVAARAAAPAATAAPGEDGAGTAGDEDVLEDLQALYAIRDASLRQGRPEASGPAGEKDFESTHPGDGPDAAPPPPKRW